MTAPIQRSTPPPRPVQPPASQAPATAPTASRPSAASSQRTLRGQDTFEAKALRFDGSTPAQGTTNTDAWVPTNPPVRGNPSDRNANTYNEVINQFAVGSNGRYTPREGNTYCNIFVWDVTRAMGAEIPHWVDRAGNPASQGAGNHELDANGTVDWLHQHGGEHGWRRVSAQEAQDLANQGHPATTVWKNPGGIGHVAVVRPGQNTSQGPAIAQAGARNFNNGHVKDSFGNAPVEYWVNDSGKSTGSPTSPPPATTPPPSSPPPSGGAVGLPSMDLARGAEGPEVKQLQDALVKLGYMTPSQVATGPGSFGPQTEAAVSKYQTDRGISPNAGYYGPLTRAAMSADLGRTGGSAPAAGVPQKDLARGAEGPEVKQLQDALVKLGYMTSAQVATGPGTFGPQTEAAVSRFQTDRGISPNTGTYGPLTRAALSQALGGQGPSTGPVTGPAPTPAPTGSDAARAARVNDMLKGSGLAGQGANIIAMSKKYNVPPELALAMFQKEAQWNTTGVAPLNNNPGNLRFVEWEAELGGVKNGGFTRFPSLDKGVEAYFRLLGSSTYRSFVDNKDWRGLVNKYAPPSDGNDSDLYARQITQWMQDYGRRINAN